MPDKQTETWTKSEIEERIALLSKKYYVGYVEPNPNAAIYMFQKKLKELRESGKNEIEI
jgi:hypothetical protein